MPGHSYCCPQCRATLNPRHEIILSAQKGDVRGLVLLSPTPGDYDAWTEARLQVKKGDRIQFLCPVCHVSLDSPVDDQLVSIAYRATVGTEGLVHFSRIFGEHATFVVSQEELTAYGENADVYGGCNFFGAGGQE